MGEAESHQILGGDPISPLRRGVMRLIFMPCHMALNWTATVPGVYRAISHTAERAVNKIFQEECGYEKYLRYFKGFWTGSSGG